MALSSNIHDWNSRLIGHIHNIFSLNFNFIVCLINSWLMSAFCYSVCRFVNHRIGQFHIRISRLRDIINGPGLLYILAIQWPTTIFWASTCLSGWGTIKLLTAWPLVDLQDPKLLVIGKPPPFESLSGILSPFESLSSSFSLFESGLSPFESDFSPPEKIYLLRVQIRVVFNTMS